MNDITDLQDLNQWVCWDTRAGRKTPISPNGGMASSTDDKTWGSYEEAVEATNVNGYDGIGFCFKKGDGLAGIDIDGCLDKYEVPNSFAASILNQVETYCEISPSGRGLKLLGLCDKDYRGKNTGEIEVYTHSRFFTVTGNCITHTDLGDISSIVEQYCTSLATEKVEANLDWDDNDVSDSTLMRSASYLEKMPPSVSGSGGHNALFAACCRMLIDYALPPKVALDQILSHFNGRCDPPWEEDDIIRKIEHVMSKENIEEHKHYKRLSNFEDEILDDETLAVNANILAVGQTHRIPKYLLRLPPDGAMNEFAKYVTQQNARQSEALSVAGAITWYSACLGRGIMDESGTKTNLYTVVLAPSSGGKQAPQDCIRAVFDRSINPDMVAGKVTSDAAIGSILQESPSSLCIWDEYGLFMQKARGGVLSTINDTLLDLWGAANSRYRLKAYADRDRDIVIDKPCFSFSGYSTADHFWSGLTRMQLRDGFAGRLMVIDTGERSKRKHRKYSPPPERLVQRTNFWINRFRTLGDRLGVPGPCDAEVEPVDDEANAVFDELWQQVESFQSDEEQAIWGRAPEKARKMALLRTLDRKPEEWIVQREDAEWGVAWAYHTSEYILSEGSKRLGVGGSFDAVKTEVFSLLKDNSGSISKTEMLKKIGCDRKLYQSVVDTLLESNQLIEKVVNRKKVLYLNA